MVFQSDRSIRFVSFSTRSKKFNIFCPTFYVGIALTRRWRLQTNKRKDIEKDRERERDRHRQKDKDRWREREREIERKTKNRRRKFQKTKEKMG